MRVAGAVPRTQRAAATTNTAMAAISTLNAKPANGAAQDSLKLKRPLDRPDGEKEAHSRGGGEADTDDGRPHPADGDDHKRHDQPTDGLGQEQRTDRGDLAVAVGLVPEVEMDVGRPQDQESADHERHGGCDGDARRGAARPVAEQAEQAFPGFSHDAGAVRCDTVTTLPSQRYTELGALRIAQNSGPDESPDRSRPYSRPWESCS